MLLRSLFLLLVAVTAVADDEILIDVGQSDRVPAWIIELPPGVTSVLIADAAENALVRYRHIDGRVQRAESRYMSVGQNGIGKQRAWDRKTPLGIYFMTEELDTSRLHDKYGVRAFVLDYPNLLDQRAGRTGDGIWLHGVDPATPLRPPRDTDGCLALPNEELLSLEPYLSVHDTPILVTRRTLLVGVDAIERTRAELRAALEDWRVSVEERALFDHVELYSDSYRADGMDRQALATFRLDSLAASAHERVALDDVMVLGDPELADVYLTRFTLTLTGADDETRFTKRLYWQRQGPDWRIIAEGAG